MLTDLEQFDEVFPELVLTMVQSDMKNPEISEASKWFKEVKHSIILYNLSWQNEIPFSNICLSQCDIGRL